jgi:uncharacterized membrane protein
MGDKQHNRTFFHLEEAGDDLSRIVALSDGLFATVLTILVLDLRPDIASTSTTQDFATFLLALWPKIFNYILTFIVVGLFWMGHHWIFEHIQAYNRRLLWLNLMFLLCVVLLPFATSLLGTPNIGLNVRWDMYAGVIILISLTNMAVWEYACAYRLVDPGLDPKVLSYLRMRRLVTPLVFFISILVEPFIGGFVSYFTILLVPILSVVIRALVGRGLPVSAPTGPGIEPLGKRLFWRFVSYFPLVVFFALSVWIFSLARN